MECTSGAASEWAVSNADPFLQPSYTGCIPFPSSPQVSEYVKERVDALRQQHPGQYGNITAIRTNAMKYLPNYFRKGQVGMGCAVGMGREGE